MSEGFGVNAETLHVLAWAANRPGLREALLKGHAEQKDNEAILRSWLHYSLPPVFELNHVYGSCYERLYSIRLNRVDFARVDWAMRGFSSVYLKDPTSGAVAGTPSEETELLWEEIAGNTSLASHLKRLTLDWQRDQYRGGKLLSLHFLLHMPLMVKTEETPFLVRELIMMSLESVNWDQLAALLLGVPYVPRTLPENPEDDEYSKLDWGVDIRVAFATLLELIRSAQVDIGTLCTEWAFSEPVRALGLALAEQCQDTHRNLALLRKEKAPLFATPLPE